MRQLHDWLKANPNFFDNPIQKPRGPANEFSALIDELKKLPFKSQDTTNG